MKYRIFFILIISLILFFIPFFWFKPGELALGGDSNRLYFYNPLAYLKSYAFYSIDPEGIGKIVPSQYLLAFLVFLIAIKGIVHSPVLIINIIDGIKLSGSFLFIYLIVADILNDSLKTKGKFVLETAGILAGIFYVFTPSVTENMKYALLIHNEVFLNPLIFYLLLKFLKSQRYIFMWILLLVTFVFSPNFTLASPPPIFSFYPLALLFIYLYIKFCLNKKIPWKGLLIGLLFFLGLHMFHIVTSILSATDSGSILFSRIVNKDSGMNYFEATRIGLGKVSLFLLLPSSFMKNVWWAAIFPLVIILGFVFNRHKNKAFFLTYVFFFITLLLISVNITNTWVAIYRLFFYIPGFSMFRNFAGQWQFIYSFFYALLLGQAFALFFVRLKSKYVYSSLVIIILLFATTSLPFIKGDLVRVNHVTTNVSVIVKMDPKYEQTLNYISSLKNNGKMLLLPLNDFQYQVVHGINNGAYVGASTIANIAGMPSYAGYISLDVFGDEFLKLAKEKNYQAIRKLLAILDIKYIFHNADPKIYDTTFSTFPYGLTRHFLPDNQKEMSLFAEKISDHKIYQNGNYSIYSLDNPSVSDFYIPETIVIYNSSEKYLFFENRLNFSAYLDNISCKKIFSPIECLSGKIIQKGITAITFEKINPTKYIIHIPHFDKPFLLVFSQGFHNSWRVYPVKKEQSLHNFSFLDAQPFETLFLKSIPEDRHTVMNGYANAWLINKSDLKDKNYLIIETQAQKTEYICILISLFTFAIFLIWGAIIVRNFLLNKRKNYLL